MSLQQKASLANGRSRACGKCKIGMRRCTPEIAEVCKNAFVEGYTKGYRQRTKEDKEKIDSILHPTDENIGTKDAYVFFRDVRGNEDTAFIDRMRFLEDGVDIGSVRFEPEDGEPQRLPIAWCREEDLLKLLGYTKKYKEFEERTLSESAFSYPSKLYYENLKTYEAFRKGNLLENK